MTEIIPILLLAAFLGGVVQGISGFAFAILFLAIMQFFLPYTELLAINITMCVVMLAITSFTYRRHIDWRRLPLPLAINVALNFGALRLLRFTADFPYWHKLLGVVFILLAVYMYFWQSRIHLKPSLTNALLFCGTGGVLQGLFGVGGPPVVLYFLAVADNKESYLATTQIFFFLNACCDFGGRCLNGMVTASTLHYALWGIGAMLAGLWCGNKLFRRIDGETLKKIVYGIMFFDGWYMLLLR